MDRLDHMQVGNDGASAFAHLEQRVSYLLERLEASTDHRSGNLGRVEEGLQDVLRHLETQHASFAAFADNSRAFAAPAQAAPAQMDSGLVDLIKRELSDMRYGQTETDRRTQDSLEVVNNTLGHVVDRLAMIEGDLRAVRTAPVPPPAPVPAPQPIPAPRAAMPQPVAAATAGNAESRCRTGSFRRGTARIPRRGAAGHARYRHAKGDQRNPRTADGAASARGDRTRSAAGSSAGARHTAARPHGVAVGAHCRFGKRHQRDFAGYPRTGQHIQLYRRRPPRRAGRVGSACQGQQDQARRSAQGPDKRCGQGFFDHHLEDSFAAGRRQRGRDRARHLQDGDDAAGQRHSAVDAGIRNLQRAAIRGAAACRKRQSRSTRAGDALDDIADADRPAIDECARANHPGQPPRRRRSRRRQYRWPLR